MNPLVYLDFETGFAGEADCGNFAGFSERHYAAIAALRRDESHTPKTLFEASGNRPVILAMHGGLPGPDEIQASELALRAGRRIFYYWPAENVVEVVTRERLDSFRLHRRVVNAYWVWRSFKRGIDVNASDFHLRIASNARRLRRALTRSWLRSADAPRFGFLRPEGDRIVANGMGLYIRLDYWARLNSGGSYGHTVFQAKALHKATAQGIVCVLASRFELLDAIGVPQTVLPLPHASASDEAVVSHGAAYRGVVMELLKFYRPAYVFERIVLGNSEVARACSALKIPYIAEYNGSEITMAKVFAGEEKRNASELCALELQSLRSADIISVVSEAVKGGLVESGLDEAKILVNPNGVDLDSYRPLVPNERRVLRESLGFSERDVVLGFCGTFGGWHGVEVLAAAIPRILEARPEAKFLLIGDGVLKHLVTGAVSQAGAGASVRDLGRVSQSEAARALAACDIFLSPHSLNMGDKPFFGSPTKLFEYMAYGAGIVCSDLQQIGEVMRPAVRSAERGRPVQAGARAVLTAPGSVEELVAACLWLIDEPGVRELLGRNARAAAEQYYTWDVHVQSLWRFALGLPAIGYHADRAGK